MFIQALFITSSKPATSFLATISFATKYARILLFLNLYSSRLSSVSDIIFAVFAMLIMSSVSRLFPYSALYSLIIFPISHLFTGYALLK